MFDVSWSHLLLVAVIALVVIGPKDLPRVLRTVGMWVGRARAVARDFQGSVDQMIREAELDEVRNEVEKATTIDLQHEVEKTIDPQGEIRESLAEPALAEAEAKPAEPPNLPAPAAAPENTTSPKAASAETAAKSDTHA